MGGAGELLDIGQIFTLFDVIEPATCSTRSGTHSVMVVTSLAMVGFLDRRHAHIWLGIEIGALSHLWRDMGTGLVPLAWPLLDEVWGTSFRRYLAGMIGLTVAMIGSGLLLDIYTSANATTGNGTRPQEHREQR